LRLERGRPAAGGDGWFGGDGLVKHDPHSPL
jgi:hypothetical protein